MATLSCAFEIITSHYTSGCAAIIICTPLYYKGDNNLPVGKPCEDYSHNGLLLYLYQLCSGGGGDRDKRVLFVCHCVSDLGF